MTTSAALAEPSGSAHLVIAGHATRTKGYELLPDAVRSVLAGNATATFTIHGVAKGAGNPEANETLERLSRLGPRVTVLTHELSSEEYYRLILSADVLLLPYRLPEYQYRGSGIFNESVRFGIPVIAPAGSNFAREAIDESRAIAMKEHSAAALADSIGEALSELATLQSNCQNHLLTGGDDKGPAAILDDFFRFVSTIGPRDEGR